MVHSAAQLSKQALGWPPRVIMVLALFGAHHGPICKAKNAQSGPSGGPSWAQCGPMNGHILDPNMKSERFGMHVKALDMVYGTALTQHHACLPKKSTNAQQTEIRPSAASAAK